jgi:glycine cleavage system transcriptional repressor
MKQQLIVNILGTDKLGILSEISACVNEICCNILDSRHAIYGTDFSLSMIVEGSRSAISKLEMHLSSLCMQHDLLSMMKRTSDHHKQNLDQLIHFEFTGVDASGILRKVTTFLSAQGVSISALRQRTYVNKLDRIENLKCKMVLSAPKDLDLNQFDEAVKDLLGSLCLTGKITHHDLKEENEHIESW